MSAERSAEKGRVHSAYGAWLAYVMNERRASTEKLAKKSGVSVERIEGLLRGRVVPSEAKDDIFRIAETLLAASPKRQMELVLKALEIHMDLRNWAAGCDGGCCPWGVAIEVAMPETLRAMGVSG